MPPIQLITAQRRLVEVGRIRLGHKVASSNGGRPRPEKLDKFRLTSRDRDRLDAAAELYGGQVKAWEGQWELYTEADVIPIAVVPAQALSVSYELWGQKEIVERGQKKKTPVICLRRCDGEFEMKSDGPCLCAGEEEMQCKPTTRVSVILTQVPGLGVWRVESHGWNAMYELQGTVELLEALVATGRPVRARLRVDKREKPTEKGVFKFQVAVIDIDHTPDQILTALGMGPGAGALDVGAAGELDGPGFKPVPELPAAPAASIADQLEHAGQPKERPQRANSQQEIPRTGLAPRGVAELAGDPSAGEGGEAPSATATSPDDDHDDNAGDDSGPALPLAAQVSILIKEIEPEGLDTAEGNDFRHRFLYAFSSGAYSSAKQVTIGDFAQLRATIVRYRRDDLRLAEHEGNPIFVSKEFGWHVPDPGKNPEKVLDAPETGDGQPSFDMWDEDRWLAEIQGVQGIGRVKLITNAQRLAKELGVDEPGNIGQITDPQLVGALQAWLGEQRQQRGAA